MCIAAMADLGKSLALACDGMLSSTDFSGDAVAYKVHPLSTKFHWMAMFAGDNLTHIMPVISRIQIAFTSLTEDSNRAELIKRVAQAAYQTERMQFAQDLVLAPLGMNLEGFLKNSEWRTESLVSRLETVSIECDFLIAGFDSDGDASIFTIEHPGVVRDHGVTGWASIGSGAYSATSTLLYHSVNWEMKGARVLYHVAEAKFMAESASGVGKHTHLMFIPSASKVSGQELSDEFIASIRTAWEIEGRPRVPEGYLNIIESALRKSPDLV